MKRFRLKSQRDHKEKIKNLLAFIAHFILITLNRETTNQQTHYHCHVKDTDYRYRHCTNLRLGRTWNYVAIARAGNGNESKIVQPLKTHSKHGFSICQVLLAVLKY